MFIRICRVFLHTGERMNFQVFMLARCNVKILSDVQHYQKFNVARRVRLA